MTISLSTVTGGAQTGFTSPTYTVTQDSAPTNLGKQWAVTGTGGTQTGVTTHNASSPFLVNFIRPSKYNGIPLLNSATGLPRVKPAKNVHKAIVLKGCTPVTGYIDTAYVRIEVGIPAGAETNDAPNIRGMMSMAIGTLNQISAGLGDSLVSGIY